MEMNRYPLKIESLRSDVSTADVRRFLDWPAEDLLETIEIFSNGPTATAFLVLTRPDVAYEFLNFKEIDGNRVTLRPELFEEMSITLSGSWLREIEDEDQTIQFEIQKTAKLYDLKLSFPKSVHGDTKTISLAGVPWKIELARARLNDKIQAIIMNRSQNVHKRLNETSIQPDAAGIQYPGNKKSAQSTNVDDIRDVNEQGKPALKLDDPQSSVDPISDLDKKGSTDLENPNPEKKRKRILKTGETKSEAGQDLVRQSSNDVDKDQPKEVKRTRVLVSKPEDMQKSESSADALDKATPVNYPASNQYQKVIKVDMDIHEYLMEHSNYLDFTDCSVSQIRVSEQQMDYVIGSNNEEDLRMNKKDLKRLIDKLRKKCYSVPNEFEFDIFKDVVESNNTNKNITLMFNPKERSCKVIGLTDEVERTYKWLIKISVELLIRNKQSPSKGSATGINDDSGSNGKGRSAHQLDAPQTRSQSGSQDFKSGIGNKQGRFPDPKENVTKAGDGIHTTTSSKDKLEFTTRGNLKVSVYQGNMIKQPTEVIVNPANEHLAHGGGLARVILDAGGPAIDEESRKIILKQGKLQTSEVVHTSAGKLPPPIKYVIHAVGPTAYEFKDNKAGLVPTIKVTFLNCLEYANKLGASSISLPPISAGIFAVPMPDIIQGAVGAIQDFDRKNPSAVLKEVHIISNDAKTTEDMISCFLKVIG